MTGAGLRVVRADDGRTLAVVVGRDFDDFASFPPEDDLAARGDGDVGKAYVTEEGDPLEMLVIQETDTSVTDPHYHEGGEPVRSETRHQVMVCQEGEVDVGVYTTDGTHVDTVRLTEGDVVLLTEGHSFDYRSPSTRLVEIKQGSSSAPRGARTSISERE